MTHTSSENLAEALKLLEEAATQKKDELKGLMSDKYTHLKNVIVETETGLVKSLTEARHHASEAATHAKEASVAKACEITRDVDKSVHQNPWAFIAGSAVVGLLLGAILGRNPK
ncbi:MAG: hypothetical protein K8T26_09280 [Lentisphaerae bacterium]|nr:hypothetical protein [Lentisphaerota bacterium]